MAAAVLLLAGVAGWVWRSTDAALERQPVERIEDRGVDTGDGDDRRATLNVLVVGSDSRGGLDAEQREELHTGEFNGERTDTILLVQVRDGGVAMLSFPRDLRVAVPGHGVGKINAALELGGPNAVVGAIEDLVGVELDHYVEVAIPSFLEIVEAAGGVELCLDDPLEDPLSGADFDPGCQEMDGPEALSFVRSRTGPRADFDRAERQQRFLSALADRATSLGVLANPVRLHDLATTVADGLTVDDGLTVGRMVELGQVLRDVLDAGLESYTLPAYAETIDGVDFVIPYQPAVEELSRRLSQREPLPPRPDDDVRDQAAIVLLGAGAPQELARVESVLFYAGWSPQVGGAPPAALDVGSGDAPVRVYPGTGHQHLAEAVAGALGAEVRQVPEDAGLDLAAAVVVVVGTPGT